MTTWRARTSAGVALAALAIGGCTAPPADEPATAPAASGVVWGTTSTTAPPDLDALARAASVRIEGASCDATWTGSGFVVDLDGGGPDAPVVLTNRHVVEGFTSLRLVTQSGDELAVTDVLQLRFADIAIIRVEGALPVPLRLASAAAAPGQDVTVFGYPGGGDLDRQTGTVIDFVRDIDFGLTEILRVDVWVRPGNSGGPMLDPTGAVVGVVYAIELATDLALAVPADAVARLTGDTTASRAVVPCGR